MTTKSTKNSVSIRLTESVVFLRANETTGRRSQEISVPTSMLRGLLTVELVKPTRISSIELELQGKAFTSWPEGVGSRRIEITEEHKIFNASQVFFRAGSTPSSRRPASVGPGLAFYRDDDEGPETSSQSRSNTPTRVPPNLNLDRIESVTGPPRGRIRRVSADSSMFTRDLHSQPQEISLPTPPYTPAMTSPIATHHPTLSPRHSNTLIPTIPRPEENPAQTLEEFRNALRNEIESRSQSRNRSAGGGRSPLVASSASSTFSLRDRDLSLSRHPSIDDVPEDEPVQPQTHLRLASASSSPSPSPSSPTRHPKPSTSATQTPTPKEDDYHNRGRKHSRFSFAAVSSLIQDAVTDRVRSSSREETVSRERAGDRSRDRAEPRGRQREVTKEVKEKEAKQDILSKFGWRLDDGKESGDGWKEFKKGTYTYPISFTIPGNSPPTLDCAYGSVIWRLKANVHRPGTFTQKLTAEREVTLIASPGEDDTEDSENIIVERQWDSQLQYLISISGRSFYIGGTMPVHFTMLPLDKVKVHRISVILEERTDYYTQMKRIARSDPVERISLLAIKSNNKDGGPILPLISDDPEAFRHSPFHNLASDYDDPSELASTLMGPGPWEFHYDLPLPSSCSMLHFTNKNKRSNIIVSHSLKIVFRVERGDDQSVDPKTGKRKLFDIVVSAPVHILSCRCNPAWTSLPRYTESLLDDSAVAPQACPCGVKLRARSKTRPTPLSDPYANRGVFHSGAGAYGMKLDQVISRNSSDSASSAGSGSPINTSTMPSLGRTRGDTLYNRNTQFERLVSGQEDEGGAAPPAYDAFAMAGGSVAA